MSASLWVFYDQYVQKTTVDELPIAMGPEEHAKLRISSLKTDIQAKSQGGQCVIMREDVSLQVLPSGESCELEIDGETFSFLYIDDTLPIKKYYIGHHNMVTVSSESSAQMMLPFPVSFTLLYETDQNRWQLYPQKDEQPLYVNGEKVTSPTPILNGDAVIAGHAALSIMDGDTLIIESFKPYETTFSQVETPTSLMQQQYPMYRRTPRILYREPKDEVPFSIPSQEHDDNERPLWLTILPQVVIIIAMGLATLLIPNGWFMLISIPIMLGMIITAVIMYFRDKKHKKKKEEIRRRLYRGYLKEKHDELQALKEKQQHALAYHLPPFEKMKEMSRYIHRRIYEKAIKDEDFLEVRVGRSTVPTSFRLEDARDEFSERERDDLLLDYDKLKKAYLSIENAPLRLSLAEGAIGYVGKPRTVEREVSQLVGQLAFAHSYHDLRFVAVLDERQFEKWAWMRWLPHFEFFHTHAKGFVYDEKACDQLLNPLYQMIRERDLDQKSDDEDEKRLYTPHIVFLVANRPLIAEHAIMEYLEGEDKSLGFSVVFLTDAEENLSEHIRTVVKAVNHREGEIVMRGGEAEHKRFSFDTYKSETNERFARTLFSLQHQQGMVHSVPDMVSFMEMFYVAQVKDLAIRERWAKNNSIDSLAAPIGFKSKDELLELNIHEKAHGPHGLLAGTTGSGKSEFLQTYILSLAINYHPHEVAFLLIDYKGGGMAQPFKNMPHLLGVITNIADSPNFSARALASIESELKKRQRLFDQHTVSHIDDYMELYKEGTAEEPMPHLLIISDEFAELKNEEDEFVKKLVSAARIGRSLGVHLILATQKPSGVVDDQIWSNSRFKVALKVQTPEDSREILKNEDAASITQTGRGYLQVGNNEQYDLFQSAWSGAQYLREVHEGEEDIFYVTDLGLKGVSQSAVRKQKKEKGKTEIEAVVEEINATTEDLAVVPAKSPWLDPLGERLVRPAVDDEGKAFPIAMIDDPERQRQFPVCYEWGKSGNVLILGASGYGKSTTLLTMLLAFTEALTPEQVHFYVLDFGNGALLPLRQLAHTGDYMKIDEARKKEKLLDFIQSEIERRTELFLLQEVSTLALYNEVSEEPLPAIILAIDNFDVLKEEFDDDVQTIIQLSRDGQSRGVYIFVTATSPNAIMPAMMGNMTTKICHYMLDDSEVTSLFGQLPFKLEAIPGRLIIKTDRNWFCQAFLPVEGDTDREVLDNVKAHIQTLNKRYEGMSLPEEMAMLPKDLHLVPFRKRIKEQESIALGLNEDTVQPVYLNESAGAHLVIAGEAHSGKSNMLKVLLTLYLERGVEKAVVFDGFDRPLSFFSYHDRVVYATDVEAQMRQELQTAKQVMNEREKSYTDALSAGKPMPTFTPYMFVIDSYSSFKDVLDGDIEFEDDKKLESMLVSLMKSAGHLGFKVLLATNHAELTSGFGDFVSELKSVRQHILVMKKTDQSLVSTRFVHEEKLEQGFGYYIVNGKETKMKIPEMLKEEEPVYTP
ncbi:type VII secretion protein EssC [Bacillus sp. FSL W7-1360]